MGEILGMGSTHWPAMIQPDEAKPWPFLRTLARDPRVPEALKDPHNWPEGVRREYGEDEGVSAHREHRRRLVDAFRMMRIEIEAFNPDFILMFGDEVAPQATVGRCTCNANGGPDILLLVRSPTLLGGQAWTPPRHSAPISTALPEAKRAKATSVSIRRRSSASSAMRVTKPSVPAKARSSIGCAPRRRRWCSS